MCRNSDNKTLIYVVYARFLNMIIKKNAPFSVCSGLV